MRTTVDLPDDLFRAAKAHAAANGTSLKTFIERAVMHELGTVPRAQRSITFPLVPATEGVRESITEDFLANALMSEDLDRSGW